MLDHFLATKLFKRLVSFQQQETNPAKKMKIKFGLPLFIYLYLSHSPQVR